ncbi:hypothetical protein ABT144_29890 [Streptomyces sp. NPDC002039]
MDGWQECGIGNIAAALVAGEPRSNFLSHPGIIGHQMRQLRTHEQRHTPGGVLVIGAGGGVTTIR